MLALWYLICIWVGVSDRHLFCVTCFPILLITTTTNTMSSLVSLIYHYTVELIRHFPTSSIVLYSVLVKLLISAFLPGSPSALTSPILDLPFDITLSSYSTEDSNFIPPPASRSHSCHSFTQFSQSLSILRMRWRRKVHKSHISSLHAVISLLGLLRFLGCNFSLYSIYFSFYYHFYLLF